MQGACTLHRFSCKFTVKSCAGSMHTAQILMEILKLTCGGCMHLYSVRRFSCKGYNKTWRGAPHCYKNFGGFRCMWLMNLMQSCICDVKCRQIEGNVRKFRHIELSNSAISNSASSLNRLWCGGGGTLRFGRKYFRKYVTQNSFSIKSTILNFLDNTKEILFQNIFLKLIHLSQFAHWRMGTASNV